MFLITMTTEISNTMIHGIFFSNEDDEFSRIYFNNNSSYLLNAGHGSKFSKRLYLCVCSYLMHPTILKAVLTCIFLIDKETEIHRTISGRSYSVFQDCFPSTSLLYLTMYY